MTHLLTKKQALYLREKKGRSDIALATLYALRKNKRISKDDFESLVFSVRAGRLFYSKQLKRK